MHLLVLVEVDDIVVGELLQKGRELVHPPRLEVGDEELHLSFQVRRGEEQRDQHVRVVVEEVVRVPGHGEDHHRDVVPARALWRDRGRGHGLDRDLHDAREEEVVLAGERANLLLPVGVERAGAGRVNQVHGFLLGTDTDVASELTHRRPRVREALVNAVLVAGDLGLCN